MSIGRRLFDLARGEINALLDHVGSRDSTPSSTEDPNEDLYRRYSLGEFSDEELEAELERRLRTRRKATQASPPKPPRPAPPKPAAPRISDEIQKAYAALEIPVGSNFEAVRHAYRSMMRKYHPDRHATSAEKQKAATELAQRLTHAYAILEKHLRG